jgi:DNA-binding response OmpR family regulator
MRIVTLSDAGSQLTVIVTALRRFGYKTHAFSDSEALSRNLLSETYDLVILDTSWGAHQVQSVLDRIETSIEGRVPVLFITERADARSVATYLTAADDFIVKPLGPEELEPRVRALIQRAFPKDSHSELFFGPYHFSLNSRSLRFKGTLLDTRLKEFELALFLFRNLGRLLSREHLRDSVWGQKETRPSRSIDTHMSRLRAKLNLFPENGYSIESVYGVGYRLQPVDRSDPELA